MPIPWGYTRGDTATRIAYLKESIEAIEDAYNAGADEIEYPNAGRLTNLKRADAEARVRQLYVQLAKLTGDVELLRQVQNNIRCIRIVGTPNYDPSRGYGFGGGGY